MSIKFDATERLLSFDQTPLFWRKHLPENPKAHVIIVHGFSEHGARYAHVAEYLARAGYGVWAMDNRGHGRSAGKRGHVDHYDDYVRDLGVFLDLVAKEAGSKKVFVLGHSNGGLIALRYALSKPEKPAGLILSDPLLQLVKEVSRLKLLAGRVIVRIAPSFSMPNELAPEELTHDPAMIEAYLADPLIFHEVTVGWFHEMEAASENARGRAPELKMPFLMLLGTADPVCSHNAGKMFFEHVPEGDKQLKLYEGFLHEIFNESGREQVMKDTVTWLDKHL